MIGPNGEFGGARPSSPVSRGSFHASVGRATLNGSAAVSDMNSVQGSVATYKSSASVDQKLNVPGVPVDRQRLISSAIRLYHSTTGVEYELEDVRDAIAEVMRWGEALITYVGVKEGCIDDIGTFAQRRPTCTPLSMRAQTRI